MRLPASGRPPIIVAAITLGWAGFVLGHCICGSDVRIISAVRMIGLSRILVNRSLVRVTVLYFFGREIRGIFVWEEPASELAGEV